MSYYTEVYHLGAAGCWLGSVGAMRRHWQIYRQIRGRWGIKGDSAPFSISKLLFSKDCRRVRVPPFPPKQALTSSVGKSSLTGAETAAAPSPDSVAKSGAYQHGEDRANAPTIQLLVAGMLNKYRHASIASMPLGTSRAGISWTTNMRFARGIRPPAHSSPPISLSYTSGRLT